MHHSIGALPCAPLQQDALMRHLAKASLYKPRKPNSCARTRAPTATSRAISRDFICDLTRFDANSSTLAASSRFAFACVEESLNTSCATATSS
eukprot:170510-Pleurochrysis_carterae.AAC.1